MVFGMAFEWKYWSRLASILQNPADEFECVRICLTERAIEWHSFVWNFILLLLQLIEE